VKLREIEREKKYKGTSDDIPSKNIKSDFKLINGNCIVYENTNLVNEYYFFEHRASEAL
jgi:hypothetical protein